LGQTQFSYQTCADIARNHASQAVDVAVLLGDLAYADSDARRWDSFGKLFDTAGCSDVPWLVIPGNHEIEPDDISGESFIPYRYRWRTPEVAAEQVDTKSEVRDWKTYRFAIRYDFGGSFYSVRLGNTHIITLNPYTYAHEKSPQVQWLHQEVSRINRSLTRYVLVLTHAPWYHSSMAHQSSHEKATFTLKASAERMLAEAKVDMLFSGHVHAYERLEPIHGICQFVVGHGGNYEKLYNKWHSKSPCTASRTGDHYGWGILHLRESTTTWQARRSDTGAIVDSVEMASGPSGLHDRGSSKECKLLMDEDTETFRFEFIIVSALSVLLLLSCFSIVWCKKRCKTTSLSATAEECSNLKDEAVIGKHEI
jgi:hypothetical protein